MYYTLSGRGRAMELKEDAMTNSFNARSTLRVGEREYTIYRLDALEKQGINLTRLPFSLRILLEKRNVAHPQTSRRTSPLRRVILRASRCSRKARAYLRLLPKRSRKCATLRLPSWAMVVRTQSSISV